MGLNQHFKLQFCKRNCWKMEKQDGEKHLQIKYLTQDSYLKITLKNEKKTNNPIKKKAKEHSLHQGRYTDGK